MLLWTGLVNPRVGLSLGEQLNRFQGHRFCGQPVCEDGVHAHLRGHTTVMKPILLIATFALAGCTSITSDQRIELRSASDNYARVTKEMSKEEIVFVLGSPQKEEPQKLTWEAHANDRNFESLVIEFNPDGHVEKMTRVINRYSFGPIGHVERRFVYVKK